MLLAKRKTYKFRKRILLYYLSLLFLVLIPAFYYFFNLLSQPSYISPLVRENIDLEKKLKDAKIAFSSVDHDSDSSYIITLTQGIKIRISSNKNLDVQVSSLQRMLRELTIEGRQIKSIDFRFEKPVVEFE